MTNKFSYSRRDFLKGTSVFAAVAANFASGQSAKQTDALEQQIRKLDMAQADAVLRGDIVALDKLWAKDFTVNSPFNVVSPSSTNRVRTGTMTFSSFVREVEQVLMHGKTVIVMGRETIVPSGTSPDAGKTLHRRFTNIWMKKKGQWRMVARHANIICQK